MRYAPQLDSSSFTSKQKVFTVAKRHVLWHFWDQRIPLTGRDSWREQCGITELCKTFPYFSTSTPALSVAVSDIDWSSRRMTYVRHNVKTLFATLYQRCVNDCERLSRMRLKWTLWESRVTPTTIPDEGLTGNPFNGHMGTSANDVLRRPAHACNDVLVLKITRAIPASKMTALHIRSNFMDNWVLSYLISSHVWKDHGTEFISKFFKSLCTVFGI